MSCGLAIGWNLLGVLDLVNAIVLGALTAPGPIQRIVPDHVSIVGTYPLVLIPAFGVPLSILLHAASLRQLRRPGGAIDQVPPRPVDQVTAASFSA